MAIHLWFHVQWSELMFNGSIRFRKSILRSTQIYKTPTRYDGEMFSNIYFETTICCKYILSIYTNVAIILNKNRKFNNKFICWHFVSFSDMNIINLLSGYSKHQVRRMEYLCCASELYKIHGFVFLLPENHLWRIILHYLSLKQFWNQLNI